MQKVANTAGALDKKLLTTRVQQGRFNKEMETTRKSIFESGFDEGLAMMFKDFSEGLVESSSGMKGLGQVFKLFFNIVRSVGNLIIPILDSLLFSLGKVSDLLNFVFDTNTGKIVGGIGLITLAMTNLTAITTAYNVVLNSIFLKFGLLIALGDELFSFFDDERLNVIESATGTQGLRSATEMLSIFSPMVGSLNNLFPRDASEKTPVTIQNNISVDGVTSSVDNLMSINNNTSLVQR